jgi:hypothetical protein
MAEDGQTEELPTVRISKGAFRRDVEGSFGEAES